MPFDFRVYGHLTGLTPDRLNACRALLSAYETEISGDVLDFVHEGGFVDADGDIDGLMALIGPETRGVIDIINHMDWEMFRLTISGGKLTRARIALDNALDTAYASERRS